MDGLLLECLDTAKKIFRRIGVFGMIDMPVVESGICLTSLADAIFFSEAERCKIWIV